MLYSRHLFLIIPYVSRPSSVYEQKDQQRSAIFGIPRKNDIVYKKVQDNTKCYMPRHDVIPNLFCKWKATASTVVNLELSSNDRKWGKLKMTPETMPYSHTNRIKGYQLK